MFSIRCNSRVNSSKNKKDPKRITKIKPFLNKYYNWGRINFPLEKDDLKKSKKNNGAIAIALYVKKIYIVPMS